MRYWITAFFGLVLFHTHAELISPKVPVIIEFADMRLKLTDDARNKIQKEVNQLTKSELYYNIKADRVKLYFSIIEKTLRAEGVPTDFKYLALQESALISDAVSSANAVGFWQFKDFTGREVGLRIDKHIDERLNVVASTVGASKYFKRHNFYFDNWVYTLLAHMTGRGGAEKYVDISKFGDKKMTIDRNTHWYIIRFLSHLIAFQDADKGDHSEGLKLTQYTKASGLTLDKIATKGEVDPAELKKYNKWLKSGAVPKDKEYTVLIPTMGKKPKLNKIAGDPKNQIVRPQAESPVYPTLTESNSTGAIILRINGIPCILAKGEDDWNSLAIKAELSETQLVKYNDLMLTDEPKEGEIYYLKPKRNKSSTYYYTAQQGESLWDVSQKFGIKVNKVAKLNRMSIIDPLKPGRVLWLRKRRPEEIPVEYRELPTAPVDEVVSVKEIIKDAKQKASMKVDTILVDGSSDKAIMITDESSDILIEITNHIVVKGESLYSIANDFDVSIQDIVEWNELPNYDLKIGQELVIHGSMPEVDVKKKMMEDDILEEKSEVKVNFHIVEPGDTMYGISRKYGIEVSKLLEINQKDNFDIVIGERIIVKQ